MEAIAAKKIEESPDTKEIKRLDELFKKQKKAFLKNRYPTHKERVERLQAVKAMIVKNRKKIQEAMKEDYGIHPAHEADLFEAMPILGRVDFNLKHLKKWMKPTKIPLNIPIAHGTSKVYSLYQPKGVIGNMAPWNFPIEIAMGPTCDALAAGNRVINKTSEITPACSALLVEMISKSFDEDLVAAVDGGLDLARHFTTLRWDHLSYTGNAIVARYVMRAAADNLVPVTLELGGKGPAIVGPDRVDDDTMKYICGLKAVKRGQTCVCVDYCLVPESHKDEFIAKYKAFVEARYAKNNAVGLACNIINKRHLDRLTSMLDEAEKAGSEVIRIGEPLKGDSRALAFSLVVNPKEDTDLMKTEIFGPIMPIVTYKTVDEAIAYMNAKESPLGLYVFSNDRAFIDKVTFNTASGGVSINCAAFHVMPEAGFGGIGESGIGRHHGKEGFIEFSIQRTYYEMGKGGYSDYITPPFSKNLDLLIEASFGDKAAERKIGMKLMGKFIKAKLGFG